MNTNTPETDAHMLGGSYSFDVDFARRLKRERDDARAEAAHWKANHDNQVKIKSILIQRPDLGDRSQRIEKLIKERDEARAQHAADVAELNQRLIDRHADMMATIVQLRQALSGRTVSCAACNESARTIAELKAERDLARERGQDTVDFLSIAEDERDHYRRENGEMREAIKEAHRIFGDILRNYECGFEIDMKCESALAKLQPFLK